MINIENQFHIKIGNNIFFKCFRFSLKGYFLVIKWFHKETHLNFKDLLPEWTVLKDGIVRQLFWTLFNDVSVEVWISELQLKKVRRSWGMRLLQYSYASFSCWSLITSWTLSIFKSINKGLASLSKSEKVKILTHFFWS